MTSRSTVVVVDDDADFQRFVARVLQEAGHAVVPVLDGREAHALIAGLQPGIVLVDGFLPGLPGPDLVRALRADARTQHLPILFVSAFARDFEADRGLADECHVDLVLHKPLQASRLLAHVERLLHREDAAASPALEVHLAGLRDEYVRSVPGKIEQLRAAAAAFRERDPEPLRRLSHRIRGIAGSYGFHEASELAGALQQLVEHAPESLDDAELARRIDGIEAALRPAPRASAGPLAEAGPGPITRVMVVEDDPEIRRLAELSLRLVGKWQVILAASGAEALQRIPQDRPDVILLDVMMPGMDGPATLGRLRELPGAADVPVFFITASVSSDEVARYLRLGVAGVISKPFDPISLPAEIRRIVGVK